MDNTLPELDRLLLVQRTLEKELAQLRVDLAKKDEEIARLKRELAEQHFSYVVSQESVLLGRIWSQHGLGPNDQITIATGEIKRAPVKGELPHVGLVPTGSDQ